MVCGGLFALLFLLVLGGVAGDVGKQGVRNTPLFDVVHWEWAVLPGSSRCRVLVDGPLAWNASCFRLNTSHSAARFTLTRAGSYTAQLYVNDTAHGGSLQLRATEPRRGALGFVKVSPNRKHFTSSIDNNTFVLKGINVAWPVCNSVTPCNTSAPLTLVAYYSQFFARLQSAHGNFARLWLGPLLVKSFNALSIMPKFGEVDYTVAAVLDAILAAATEHGVVVLLALDSFNSLCPNAVNAECHYDQSVFNEANGGPLDSGLGAECVRVGSECVHHNLSF